MHQIEWLSDVRDDVAYAVRRLLKAPAFSFVAILTLALGTGATTAIFSVVRAVALRPLPITNVDRVVRMFETNPSTNSFATSELNYLDYRDRSKSFSAFAAWKPAGFSLLGHGDPVALSGSTVTASYFAVMDVKPIIGALYGPDNDRPGGDTHVVVLSEGIWRRVFGADRNVVGSTLDFDGVSYRVTGVAPSSDSYLPSDFWVPLAPNPAGVRNVHDLRALGRLKPGVSLEQAQADVKSIGKQLAVEYPVSNGDWGGRIIPFDEWILGPSIRRQMLVLLGAVGFVLLLACANVGNLLLVRGTARQRELSIRVALGAGRGRIIRQLITESGVLAVTGALFGLLLAIAAVPLLRRASPGNIPRLEEASIDPVVLLFTLGITAIAGLIFGVAPALTATRTNLQLALRQSSRAVSALGRRTRSGLVVAEVALAVMLLVGAGLLNKSFVKLAEVPTGFRADAVLQLTMPAPASMARDQRIAFFQNVETAIAQVPGVTSVGSTNIVPFAGGNSNTQFIAEGHDGKGSEFFAANWRSVSPGFFPALGIPVRVGRGFDANDLPGHPRVALIDETMAKKLWPNGDAIGKHIMAASSQRTPADQIEIVGVVGFVRDLRPSDDPAPTVYIPVAQRPWTFMTYLAKTRGEPKGIIDGIQRAMRQTAPNTPTPTVTPLAVNLENAIATQRFTAWLLVAFSVVAMTLAAVGIYGVISYSVAQRTSEMGIRLALGALPSRVATMVLLDGCTPAVIGVVVGSISAVALSRLMTTLLFGTSPTDVATYSVVAVVLLSVAAAASLLPARRAASVDPLVALRSD